MTMPQGHNTGTGAGIAPGALRGREGAAISELTEITGGRSFVSHLEIMTPDSALVVSVQEAIAR